MPSPTAAREPREETSNEATAKDSKKYKANYGSSFHSHNARPFNSSVSNFLFEIAIVKIFIFSLTPRIFTIIKVGAKVITSLSKLSKEVKTKRIDAVITYTHITIHPTAFMILSVGATLLRVTGIK